MSWRVAPGAVTRRLGHAKSGLAASNEQAGLLHEVCRRQGARMLTCTWQDPLREAAGSAAAVALRTAARHRGGRPSDLPDALKGMCMATQAWQTLRRPGRLRGALPRPTRVYGRRLLHSEECIECGKACRGAPHHREQLRRPPPPQPLAPTSSLANGTHWETPQTAKNHCERSRGGPLCCPAACCALRTWPEAASQSWNGGSALAPKLGGRHAGGPLLHLLQLQEPWTQEAPPAPPSAAPAP